MRRVGREIGDGEPKKSCSTFSYLAGTGMVRLGITAVYAPPSKTERITPSHLQQLMRSEVGEMAGTEDPHLIMDDSNPTT